MKLPLEQVRHVARLARLALSPEEEERYAAQLGAVLEYARQLEQLDTTAVPPTSHALSVATPLAGDEILPSLDPAAAVANAPDARGTSVAVPKILE
jgi:aspartyl-tRNA(Asn)/glutamyl-tRNA(Gln) amidotransferase subunit C